MTAMTEASKDKQKQYAESYRAGNREKARLYAQAYRSANVEKRRQNQAAYYAKNKEKAHRASAEWKKKNPQKNFASQLKWRYGLTPEQVRAEIEKQNHRCAICMKEKLLMVDHCHSSGKFRGMLCRTCNMAIGLLKDDPNVLRSATVYLGSRK